MLKEFNHLVGAILNFIKPFAASVDGSKVASIELAESLPEEVDILLLGRRVIFTFYRAQGLTSSLSKKTSLSLPQHLLEKAENA